MESGKAIKFIEIDDDNEQFKVTMEAMEFFTQLPKEK